MSENIQIQVKDQKKEPSQPNLREKLKSQMIQKKIYNLNGLRNKDSLFIKQIFMNPMKIKFNNYRQNKQFQNRKNLD